MASGGTDDMVRIWHLASGRESSHFLVKPPARPGASAGPVPPPSLPFTQPVGVRFVRFSPDGGMILTFDSAYQLWDTATGRLLATLDGHFFPGECFLIAFSPDGKWLLGWGSAEEQAVLWSTATGKVERTLHGHAPSVRAAGFLAEGRLIFTCSGDGRTRLWDVRSGEELCTVIAFTNGTWAVVDPQGRYDASNGGHVEGLHWVVGSEPIGLDQLKDRYYEPGLLAKILGFNKESLKKVEAFTSPKLYPVVELVQPTAEKPQLGIHLTARDGGIGRVVVKINGKELLPEELPANARGATIGSNAKQLAFAVDLSHHPCLKPGEENVIEVQVYNAEGYLRSRGYRMIYASAGAAEVRKAGPLGPRGRSGALPQPRPRLALRRQGRRRLRPPALRIAATRWLGADRVHLVLLSSTASDSSRQPVRANLVAARSRSPPRPSATISWWSILPGTASITAGRTATSITLPATRSPPS